MRYIKLTTDCNGPCKVLVNWDAVKWARTNPNLNRYPTAISFIHKQSEGDGTLICEETTDQIAEQLDTLVG